MPRKNATHARGDGERGSSLVEVLVALLIFLILMVGVLQMFSMAFLINKGAAERTEMTYKCQQVIENMRYLNYLYVVNPINPLAGHSTAALPNLDVRTWWPLTDGATHDLYSGGAFTGTVAALQASYWGPTHTNVVESPNPRYAVSMRVADGGSNWVLTVTCKPNTLAAANKYLGYQPKRRFVEYVANLQK